MRIHIDWLTFTLTLRYEGEGIEAYARALRNGFVDTFGAVLADSVFAGDWQTKERSRAPYQHAYTDGELGVSIFASPTLTHFCVEISGQGCERLIELDAMNAVLTCIHERCTRVDIACDIETDTKPSDFVACTAHERMRASGYQKSESGETSYVGSQKSDRYARVYRYFAPHPRSHLLRVEHVFRRDYAKAVARGIMESGERSVAKSAGSAFGWQHSVWKPGEIQEQDISVVKAERNMGKTVYWLIKACAPAFKRMCSEGVITDPELFLQTYFKPE